jgi:hypothetical protein
MPAFIHKAMRKMLLRWREDDFPYRQLFVLGLFVSAWSA